MTHPLASLCLTLAFPAFSAAQETLYRVDHPEALAGYPEADRFGYELEPAGDLDGDGVPDFLASAREYDGNYVLAVSGWTGEPLHFTQGFCGIDDVYCFTSMAALGDVNGDGLDDFAIGDPRCNDYYSAGEGSVTVYSGDGGYLYSVSESSGACGEFAFSVASLRHDLDGDRVQDFAVSSDDYGLQMRSGANGALIWKNQAGQLSRGNLAWVGDVNADGVPDVLHTSTADSGWWNNDSIMISGVDGSMLFTVSGFGNTVKNFRTYATGMGDLNGDGRADFAIGDPNYGNSSGGGRGRVAVFLSPALNLTSQPEVLYSITGQPGEQLTGATGRALASGADVDGDGLFDLFVGGANRVRAYSGWSGSLLPGYPKEGAAPFEGFGHSLAVIGDINGDGVAELAAGAPSDTVGGVMEGSVTVFSTNPRRRRPLEASAYQASIRTGSWQDLELDAGADNAGNAYWVLGSLSGFDPGLELSPGWVLPLSFDRYTDFGIANPNRPPLYDGFGVLDSEGKASAGFSFGPTYKTQFAGVTLNHAYFVMDAGGEVVQVSNPVPLTLRSTLDCNQNGIPDYRDLLEGSSSDVNSDGVPDDCQDCNGNGTPDELDIAWGIAPDLDGNGVPDDCDPDCNGNGVPDSIDVGSGTSPDVDGNGVPDECQPDCNGNGLPDPFELLSTAQDCNHNGVLDECDIASGFSKDCDLNGVPDECQSSGCVDCNQNGLADDLDIAFGNSLDMNGDGVPDDCQVPRSRRTSRAEPRTGRSPDPSTASGTWPTTGSADRSPAAPPSTEAPRSATTTTGSSRPLASSTHRPSSSSRPRRTGSP